MNLKKIMLLLIGLTAVGLFFYLDLDRFLTLESLKDNRQLLQRYYAEHALLVVAAFMAIYIIQTGLALPGATILSLAAGAVFGPWLGTLYAVTAASIGATVAFLMTRYLLRDAVINRFGDKLETINTELEHRGLNYLLFLRLVPAFPFVGVNLAPALLGVPLGTYVLGTLLGIIPGTTAFSVLGAGLGSAVESQNAIYNACLAEQGAKAAEVCTYSIDTKSLVTPELLAAFALLGVVALIPVAIQKFKSRKSSHGNA